MHRSVINMTLLPENGGVIVPPLPAYSLSKNLNLSTSIVKHNTGDRQHIAIARISTGLEDAIGRARRKKPDFLF